MNRKHIFSVLSSAAILLALHSNAPVANAESQKLNELQQQHQQLQNESNNISIDISGTESEMNSLDSERQQLTSEIQNLQVSIDDLLSKIVVQEEEIARLEEEINQLNIKIQELVEKIESRNQVIEDQARNVQISGSPENIVDLVLSAESLTDLVGKIEVISTLVTNNNNIMQDQIEDKKQVEIAAAQVQEKQNEATLVRNELESSRNTLVAEQNELDNKVALVTEKYNLTSSERDSLVATQSALQARSNEINQQIGAEQARIAEEKRKAEEAARQKAAAEAQRIAEQKAAEERAAAQKAAEERATAQKAAETRVEISTSSKAAAPAQSAPAASKPAPTPKPAPTQPTNSGGWARPARGYVTSEFNPNRMHPVYGYARPHNGIDIGGGGSITATRSGTVVTSTYHYSLGNYVVVDHGGGMRSLYAHLSNRSVSVGQSVSQGQHLGTMGTTGTSTGVHLHFEIHRNSVPVNPRQYVSF